MKRILARIGIGTATVDTVLPTTRLTQGDSVDAEVQMHGGSTDQDIDAIYFALETRYRDEEGYRTTTLSRKRVTDPFTLDAEEERSINVTFEVPRETPVTMGKTEVWLDTGLDVEGALDPDDRDHVEVRPGPHLDALFDALEDLGFGFYTASCERPVGCSPRGSPRSSSSAPAAARSRGRSTNWRSSPRRPKTDWTCCWRSTAGAVCSRR